MRFFEYEARKSSSWRGFPSPSTASARPPRRHGLRPRRSAAQAVIKSQVLTGGRMKAGGVKFADTPEEAAAHAEAILALEINGHMPRGVLVDPQSPGQTGVLRLRSSGTAPASGR